jgi:hypothetical protein
MAGPSRTRALPACQRIRYAREYGWKNKAIALTCKQHPTPATPARALSRTRPGRFYTSHPVSPLRKARQLTHTQHGARSFTDSHTGELKRAHWSLFQKPWTFFIVALHTRHRCLNLVNLNQAIFYIQNIHHRNGTCGRGTGRRLRRRTN